MKLEFTPEEMESFKERGEFFEEKYGPQCYDVPASITHFKEEVDHLEWAMNFPASRYNRVLAFERIEYLKKMGLA